MRAIRYRQRKRLPLTDQERIVLAYSRYGDAAWGSKADKEAVDDGEQVRHNAGA